MQNFIFEEIFDHFNELCSDRNGLCVIKIIVSVTTSQRDQQRVIQKISKDLIQTVSNPYGNYAVSEIVTQWDSEVCTPIFNQLATKISELSIQKYSSPVIETCLRDSNDQTRAMYINEIARSTKLHTLINHNYGNYVVQSALKLAAPSGRDALIAAIQRSIPQI